MDIHLIQIRRAEIEAEIVRLKQRIADDEKELADLDTAERVIGRLSGAKRSSAGPVAQSAAPAVNSFRSATNPTIPQKITHVMTAAALFNDGVGMKPKEIAAEICKKWGPHRGDQITPIVWRMWQRAELVKREDGTYALPEIKSASGSSFAGKPEAGFLFNPPAQGREAGPGGGT